MPDTPTPPNNTLRRFLLGELPSREAEAVCEWIDADPAAAATLGRLNTTDTVLAALAQPAPDIACPDDVLDRVVNTIVQLSPPVVPEPALGEEIEGFRLVREIGRGGMGVVFEAWDTTAHRSVAVKFIAGPLAADPDVRDRFLREARAAAAIRHPNVVPIYHVGKDSRRLFLVMPLLEGETLTARLAGGQPLPVAEFRKVAGEVTAGLAALHAAGLIHRDLKPENIWLDAAAGQAMILDFGLAKPVDATTGERLTRDGAVIGTPHYMSPEQAQGEPLDARSDLFSLGAVLYEAATGERAFTGDGPVAVLAAVLMKTPADPAARNPSLPPRLASVIRSLLEKNPAARPASASAVVGAFAESLPKVRRRVSVPWRAATAGLLLMIGAAVAVYQIEFKTKDGTLVVDVSGDADVRFSKGELHIYGADGKLKYTLKPGERNAKLPPGVYTVKVVGVDGVELDTPEFAMKQDGRVIIRATAKPVGPEPKPEPVVNLDADREAAEYVLRNGGLVGVNGKERSCKQLTDLPKEPFRLTWVEIDQKPGVTDAGLTVFQNCTNLVFLGLGSLPQVTDAGLAHFRNCTKLEVLGLSRLNITNAGLSNFKACTRLKVLALHFTAIGNEGLAHFKNCTRLESVGASYSKISDGAFDTIRNWKELVNLGLDYTAVGDASLASLKELTSLRGLGLGGTQVTDEGLAHLEGFSQLRDLRLEHTKVTPARAKALSEKLPYCLIEYGTGQRFVHPLQPDRIVAEAVISAGGAVRANGEGRDLRALAELPKEPFRVTWVLLGHKPGVWDSGFPGVDHCESIQLLDLRGTSITDVVVPMLKSCKKLTSLDLRETKLTPGGVDAIHKALPECRIVTDWGNFGPKGK